MTRPGASSTHLVAREAAARMVDVRVHGSRHWYKPETLLHARQRRSVPLSLSEIASAAISFPILFSQHDCLPHAVLRLDPDGEPVFVSASGGWHAAYVPARVAAAPFDLVASSPNGYAIALDEALASSSQGVAYPVFAENGALSPETERHVRRLRQHAEDLPRTQAAVRKLKSVGVLRPIAELRSDSSLGNFDATWLGADPHCLGELADAEVLRLHRCSALALAQAQRMSMAHLSWLARAEAAAARTAPRNSAVSGARGIRAQSSSSPASEFLDAIADAMARSDAATPLSKHMDAWTDHTHDRPKTDDC